MRRASSATPVRNPALAMSRDSVLRDTPLSATRFPRSASSQGSRWATEDRLAIRRNPSFPIQQTAPKPYLAACAEITPRGRNWNAEFQLAWEMDDHSIEQAEQRMEALRQMERDFEREAAATIVKIVRLEKDMPHELPKFVQCFRVKNIFFRILPDSRSGRNYIASLRGILQSGSALLSVPLSIMFYYRGMPVLAQALVPMAAQPKRLYGANSIGDVEVEAEMAFIAEALHIALPDSSMEVYEALDGRYYVTNSNATLTPLFLDDTIMKRQEMLRTCPGVVDGADNTMDVIDSPALQDAVMQVCSSSPPTVNTSGTLTQLCAVLHSRGVNLCLLKQVARRLLFASNYEGPAVRNAVSLIACEMLSRTLKQEFYIEVQGKRIAYDEAALTRLLSKYFALVFAPAAQFQAKFLDTVSKKYGLTAEDDDVLDVLVSFRAEWRSRIMDRVCHLLGATIRKESGELQVSWRPFANSSVVPQLVDPRVAIELVETYTKVRTDPPHWHAFCLPLCWKVACWQRRFALALKLAREDAAAQRDRPGAMALVRAFMERCVCHVCFRAGEWPQVEAGRALFPQVLAGYEAWASEKTQGRRCTEYAFWLVDVAEGLRESPAELRSCVEEAVFYFQSAIARMPKYLRSEHGAWLHLQPYIGLLRCKKLLHSCSVDTQSLVQHSVELSKIGWASDFFINYLWDLGRELAYEGDFAGAIRVLRTAIALSKEKPTFAAELHTLLMDTAHVYRSWDLRLYATECLELTNEAIDYAAKYYGTASRQYGVMLNNRGAIEIELGRLDAAEETLRRAGAALDAAGVPHDDPDYLAYLRNLEALRRRRHPSEPAAVPLHSFLLRYPFLQTGCEDMPWDDVRPLEDGEFVRLARCRAQEAGGTAEAFRLEAAMKARVGSLFRRLLAGATLQRFPFLPPLIDGVYVESLRLQHDGLFQELATPWQRLPSGSEARRLQERLALAYVAVKVRRTQRRRAYEHAVERQFVDSFGSAVNLLLPVDVAELVEDAAVQQLTERYDAKAAHRGTAAELRSVAERIGERVEAWEREQWDWRQSLSAWVPKAQLHSFHLADVAFDGPLRDLLTARQHAARTRESLLSPRELDARIEARCAALWERGQLQRLYSRSESAHLQAACRLASPRIRQQQLSSVFEDLLEPWSFSLHTTVELDDRDRVVAAVQRRGRAGRDVEVVEQWYPHLRALHCSGDVVAELPRRFDSFYHGLQLRWQQGGCSDAALHARLRLHIEACQSRARKARAGLMRDRLRTEAKYPFLRSRYEGIHLHDIKAEDDVVFREYYDEYARLASAARLPVRQMQACEGRMETRVLKLAKELRGREAALQQRFGRFLQPGDAAPLWCGAGLEYHPRMLQCEHYYAVHKDASAGSRPSRDAARCVQEIRSYARSAARDDYELRRLRSLADEEAAERYPFLSLRPLPSVPLSALPFECCYDFRREYAELCALMAEAAAVDADGADGAGSSVLSSPASMPSALSERLADKTQRLAAIVQEMAKEETEEQQRLRHAYANVPMEVLGLPSTQLVLPAAFAELWRAATQEGFRGDATSQAFGALCDAALDVRALTLANLYADEHHLLAQPFLLYHTRVCVSLRHLPLHDDQRYAALRQQYDSLLHHESYNSAVTSLQRVRLAARADRLALRTSQAWDNLLAQLPQSLSVEDNQLQYLTSHADVYRGAARNAGGKLTSTGKKQIIEALETSALRDVNQATADLRLRADLPFTAPHLHASDLERDAHFTTLRKQLKTLRGAAPGSQADLANAEEAIRDYTALFAPPTIEEITTPTTTPQPPQTARSRTPQRSTPQTPPRQPPRRLPQDELAARYPFLRLHDVEGWPEAIVADKDFQRLEAEYAELMRDPEANADALRAVEDAMNERGDAVAAALLQAAALQDLATRYPFLRLHDVDGWPEAIVADKDFQRLETEYAELMRDPEANADALRAVEDAMNARGDAVAAALRQAAALQDLATRYPFLRLHDVEGWPEAIVADKDFQRLEAEYAELMRDPEANADALRAVEDAMNARGDAVAAALRQAAALQDLAARYPFLRLHDVEGWPEAIVADKDFQRLETEYAELMRDPEANADALRAVEDAMNARGDAVAAALRQAAALQDLAARYPFLRLHDVEGWPEAIVADKDFQRLETEYAELMRDPEANADALHAVEDAMNARGDAVAAALLQAAALQDLATRYPFLRLHDVEGWPEAIVADKDFQRLEAEYAELMRDPEANADALRAVEDAMNARGDAVAAALRQAAALQDLATRYPFLRLHDVEGWPEAIVADKDFQRLETEYAELMRDPEANADALRAVEDAMNARGDAVAAALRQAAALQDLATRYPFLRLHDVDGWPEAIVADKDFQRLEAEYAELMRDPEANADALRAVEDAMNARGDAVAAALRQAAALQDLAARYPFLRLHDVDGWPEAIVADGDFQRLETEYAELMRDPEANADALRAVEDAMNERGDAVAAALRQAAALQDLAARYPFLRLHDVDGWPEAIVADKDFQRLEAEYAELMRDPEANADALRAVEDAMNARGDAVAAALRQAAALQDLAARYPFLRLHDVDGWPEAIVADKDFQRLEAEYAELMRDPEANADALRAVEDAMNARGDAVAAALRQAAALQDLATRYPFLRLHDVDGWPEAIVADKDFQRLETEYAELMRDPEANADALRAVEDAMNERGDAVAAALRQAAALQDLATRYPFLRLHDVDGWPEAIVADKDFQRLETEYAELMRDPEANADALRAVEDAMNARGDAVAAALRQAAALQDLATRYPFLRLHDVDGWPEAIVADKDFQRLETEYAELMRDPEANADALRAVEDAMNARGERIAVLLSPSRFADVVMELVQSEVAGRAAVAAEEQDARFTAAVACVESAESAARRDVEAEEAAAAHGAVEAAVQDRGVAVRELHSRLDRAMADCCADEAAGRAAVAAEEQDARFTAAVACVESAESAARRDVEAEEASEVRGTVEAAVQDRGVAVRELHSRLDRAMADCCADEAAGRAAVAAEEQDARFTAAVACVESAESAARRDVEAEEASEVRGTVEAAVQDRGVAVRELHSRLDRAMADCCADEAAGRAAVAAEEQDARFTAAVACVESAESAARRDVEAEEASEVRGTVEAAVQDRGVAVRELHSRLDRAMADCCADEAAGRAAVAAEEQDARFTAAVACVESAESAARRDVEAEEASEVRGTVEAAVQDRGVAVRELHSRLDRAMADCCADEAAGRAAVAAEEQDARFTAAVACVESAESAARRDVEAEEASEVRGTVEAAVQDRGVAVRELHSRLDRAMADCCADEAAGRAAVAAEEQDARFTAAVACVESAESAARRDVEAEEAAAAHGAVEAAVQDRGVAVRELHSRLDRAMADCCADEEAGRGAVAAEEQDARLTTAVACVESAESAARRDVEAEEASEVRGTVEAAVQDRGVAVRELHSRLDRAMADCCADEAAGRAAVAAEEQDARFTAAVACVESAESAARRDVEAEEAAAAHGAVEAAVQDRGVAVRELHSRLDRAMADCCADEAAGRAAVAAEEQDARFTAAVACVESAESAARRDVEAEEASEVRGTVEAAVQDRGVAVRELHSRLDRAMADCCADEAAGRAAVAAEEQDARFTAAVACVESAESAARRDVEAEEASEVRGTVEAAVQDRGVAVRELHSRLDRAMADCCADEAAGRAAVAAEEQDARFTAAVACVESAESAARRDVEAEEASEVRGTVEAAVQDRGVAVRELHSRLDRAMADCCADEAAGRAAVAAEEQDARFTAAVACVESAESAARRDVEAEEASEVRGTVEAAVQDRGVAVRELHSRLDRAMADCCADEAAGRAAVAAEEQDARFTAAVACVESAESAARRDVEAEEASEVRGTVEAAVQDRGVAVRELHSRLDRAMADCCADEAAGRAAVAAEEQDARFTAAVACVESAESAARRDVEAEEAAAAHGAVEAAVQDRGVAVRELHSRLDRAMADCCADEEAGRGAVAAEEQDARFTAAVACVESAESAARRDVEAEEAAAAHGAVEAAVQDRGVAVRELHSRLDRAMADCCADEAAGRAAVAAEEQDARFTAAVACVESAESAARRDVEAEEAAAAHGAVEAAVQDRGVAVRELHSRLDRAMADCCADEAAGRAAVAAEEQDARFTAAVACVESAESAARRDVEAEEASEVRGTVEAAVQDRGVAVRELHSRLDRAMADCCADEAAGRAAVAAEEQDARFTAAVACVESAESAARRDVEAEEAAAAHGAVEAAVQDRGVAVRELHSRLDRAMADCCADEAAGRAAVAAEEQDARFTAAVACVESAESAARRDVEAEEASEVRGTVEAAVQDRGVAVRELHSRLDRAMADCCADEAAGRAAVAAEEQDARFTAAVACVESAESAARRDVEAEEASEVRGTVEAAVQDRGVAVRELHSRLDRAMADCCADEEAGRGAVAAEEQDARLTTAVACVESAESAARRDVEAEEAAAAHGTVEAAVQDRGVAVRELHSRLDRAMADCCADEEAGRGAVAAEEQDARLTTAVACVESAESAARRDVEAEEAEVYGSLLQAEAEVRLETQKSRLARLKKQLRKCLSDEDKHRRVVEGKESTSRSALAESVAESVRVHTQAVKRRNALCQDEALARTAVELDEKGDWVLLTEQSVALLSSMAETQQRTAAAAEAAARAESSTRLLQRVGRGHLLRRKLQCRLENRRREAHKRGVAKILADEFTQRRALAGEEYLARQELGGRAAAALALAQRGEHMSLALQELMVEESSERGRIASDAAAEWSAIERAEHKQFIKHNSAYVSAEATDSEADEEELEVPHLPVPQVNGLPSVESHGREKQRRSYKGFDLDALGQFLLDYESDLNRMQMELADLRRTVAFEHDQLKDARDRTVQEVVRGGTGAMWVPARPLPLSDLVRGPSAQYERRKRH